MAELTKYDPKTGRAYVKVGRVWQIRWSADMEGYMRRKYATTKNATMAAALGISTKTLIGKAREMGLWKDRTLLRQWQKQNLLIANAMYRAKGCPNCFKPGNNLGKRFEKGHQLTEEQREKQQMALKRALERKRTIKMMEQLTKQLS